VVSDETLTQARELQKALAARLQATDGNGPDSALLEQARSVIEQLQQLMTELDGQLATMRYLAQQRYRPKTEKVPPGQLALDLLGPRKARTKRRSPATKHPLQTKSRLDPSAKAACICFRSGRSRAHFPSRSAHAPAVAM